LNDLQADRIEAPYQQVVSEKGTGILLSSLSGRGETSFQSEPANLSSGSSERFRAEFSGSGAGITRLRLEGKAYLRSEAKLDGAGDQGSDELWCSRLDLKFEEAGVPEYCLAEGPVRLLHSGAGTTREITAGGKATITYSDGRPKLLQAAGGCRLRSDRDVQHSTMTAPSFRLRFLDGRPSQGFAEGGTVLTFQNPEEELLASSAELITDFLDGAPAQAAFSGDFKLNRKDRAGTLQVAGDEGRYDLVAADLSIAGKERPELSLESGGTTFRTRAEELKLSRQKESISADRNVESASEGSGGISVITAQHMESSTATGWIRYTGRPRVVQDENLVNAAEIRVNRAEGALEAEGGVDSVWVDRQKTEAKQFQVRSERMQILTSENRAVYEGDVVLEAEGLLLKAPRLEAYFATAPTKGVERIEASGGVDIREQGRHWETEKAVYYRATDRVVAVK
jgi:lipopolysaccharide export system protein LptA